MSESDFHTTSMSPAGHSEGSSCWPFVARFWQTHGLHMIAHGNWGLQFNQGYVITVHVFLDVVFVDVNRFHFIGGASLSRSFKVVRAKKHIVLGDIPETVDKTTTDTFPADTLRNDDVVITSKRRHFDVKMTSFWRYNDVRHV